ncbi:MAG TPA: thymidine phosphorylase [Fimbriimonadaceae bacterium]|nr:thymidine phosphorylase [Fimbriimonadaceae bacterium]
MQIGDLIAQKRDGGTHTAEELAFIANGAADGSLSDADLTSWLHAAFDNPLSPQETADLTLAMAHSGERVDLTGLPKPWVDKHSTGGVGDKTSIVLLPLLASCGLTVVKMSGRGLGITGGTVDKLGSVPGFRLDLSPEEMKAQAAAIGVALTGQTPRLAPADKRLYAIRDVTGTVASVPLIVSSILSKKIAGGAEVVILDVKCGSGSFMKTLPEAEGLARALLDTSKLCGLDLHTSITDMDQPLGRAVGNALEVKEAIRVLKGEERGRFRDLCLHFAGLALSATGKGSRSDAERALDSGLTLAKAKEWFGAQGGDLSVFDSEDWCVASSMTEVRAASSGWVERIDARAIGQAVVDMGGGRKHKEDEIDPTVGIVLHVEVGDSVEKGQTLATVHGTGASIASAIIIVGHDCSYRPVIVESVP